MSSPRADYAVACGLSNHSEQVESFLIHTKLRNTCSWFLNGHHETGTTKSWRKEVSHVQNIQQLLLRGGSKWNSFQFSNAIILTKQRRIQFRVEVLHIVQKWSLLHFFASDDIALGVPCDTAACLLVRLTKDSESHYWKHLQSSSTFLRYLLIVASVASQPQVWSSTVGAQPKLISNLRSTVRVHIRLCCLGIQVV